MAAVITRDVAGRVGTTRTRPWAPLGAAVLAAALLAWAISMAVGQHDRPDEPARLEGDAVAIDGPHGLRSRPTTVALGDGRVLVWGGTGALPGGGGLYDPATDSWEGFPDPPGPVRSGATGVWTGEEVVIAGGRMPNAVGGVPLEAAAWSPSTGAWRALPPAPFDLHHARGVAVAGGVLFAGGSDLAGGPQDALWLDLESEEWAPVALPIAPTHLAIDGTTVLAVGPLVPQPGAWGADDIPPPGWAIVRFDPGSGSWTQVGPELDARWATVAPSAAGPTVVALSALDAPLTAHELVDGEWRVVAASQEAAAVVRTIEVVGYPPVALWTGEEHLVGGTRGLAAWAPGEDEFRVLSDRRLSVFGAVAVWTGDGVVALSNQENEGWVFRPRPSIPADQG